MIDLKAKLVRVKGRWELRVEGPRDVVLEFGDEADAVGGGIGILSRGGPFVPSEPRESHQGFMVIGALEPVDVDKLVHERAKLEQKLRSLQIDMLVLRRREAWVNRIIEAFKDFKQVSGLGSEEEEEQIKKELGLE